MIGTDCQRLPMIANDCFGYFHYKIMNFGLFWYNFLFSSFSEMTIRFYQQINAWLSMIVNDCFDCNQLFPPCQIQSSAFKSLQWCKLASPVAEIEIGHGNLSQNPQDTYRHLYDITDIVFVYLPTISSFVKHYLL